MSCPDYGLGQLIDLTHCLREASLLFAFAGLATDYRQWRTTSALAPVLGGPGMGRADYSAQPVHANLPRHSY
jgi:hypothetical protein